MSDLLNNESLAEPAAVRWRLVLPIAVGLGVLFLFNEHNFALLSGQLDMTVAEYREAQYMGSVDDTEELISTGSNFRRVSFPLLGMCGLGLLMAGRRRHAVNVPLLLLVGLFYFWCIASVTWSEAPTLTTKRLLLLSFCLLGILGLARSLTVTELAHTALLIASGFVLFSLGVELLQGAFEPWAADYRFAGIVHPNTQGGYCGTMLMSALAISVKRQKASPLLLAAIGLALLLMLLTKSRSTLAGVVLASVTAWMIYAPAHKRIALLTVAPLVLTVSLAVMAMQGLATERTLESAAALGRDEESKLETLNGRVPLWRYLLEPIGDSPLVGYGFDSFWTPQQIQRASDRLEWTIPNSHNVLLEVQLNLGLVGTMLFGAIGGSMVLIAVARLHRTREPILVFPVALGLFACANSMFEAAYSQPNGFDAFMAYAALAMTALLPSRVSEAAARESQQNSGADRRPLSRRPFPARADTAR